MNAKITGKVIIIEHLRDGWSLRWTEHDCAGLWHLVKDKREEPVHGVTARGIVHTIVALRSTDPENASIRTWTLDPTVELESEHDRKNRVAREKRARETITA